MTKITSQQLHICASVLFDAQWRGVGGRFEGGEQALLQGAHFLAELASKPDDTVTGPRELLRETADPNAALDTLAAEAQEASEYDDVGDWREYVYDRADLRSFGWHGYDRVMAGLHTSATPQGAEFWREIENGNATREKMRRAKAFVRRVLEAMEEEHG